MGVCVRKLEQDGDRGGAVRKEKSSLWPSITRPIQDRVSSSFSLRLTCGSGLVFISVYLTERKQAAGQNRCILGECECRDADKQTCVISLKKSAWFTFWDPVLLTTPLMLFFLFWPERRRKMRSIWDSRRQNIQSTRKRREERRRKKGDAHRSWARKGLNLEEMEEERGRGREEGEPKIQNWEKTEETEKLELHLNETSTSN